MEKKKLTKKQLDFCREYIKNGHNATAAAISAGYSTETARFIGAENLTKPNIKEFLSHFEAINEEKFNYSLVDHVKDLDEIADLARKVGDYRTVLKAKENKGKVCGHYTEKHSVEGDIHFRMSWGVDEDN